MVNRVKLVNRVRREKLANKVNKGFKVTLDSLVQMVLEENKAILVQMVSLVLMV